MVNCEYKHKEIKSIKFNKHIKKILKEENLYGLNITIPFKESIIPHLDKIDKHSKAIGAVNCVVIKKNKLFGFNTDWVGYQSALKKISTKKDRVNKSAMIIGYGGAAKAILYALLKFEYKTIHIFNRSVQKFNNLKNSRVKTHHLSNINKFIDTSSLLVNTTPINI